jgi:predicted acetyltransferase
MVFLTEPTVRYRKSFLEGLREFQHEGAMLQYSIQRLKTDFESYLVSTQNGKDPARVRPGSVAAIQYWLIEGDESDNTDGIGSYIGTLTVRPELNELFFKLGGHIGYQIRPSWRGRGYGKLILRMGLQKARDHGLKRALVTCDETNMSSQKVIEYNGGRFENAVCVEGSSVKKLRYWIELAE